MNEKLQASLDAFYIRLKDIPDFQFIPDISSNTRGGCGDTPLHVAAIWGDVEAIKVLLAAGADINAKGEFDSTPLHYAVGQNHVDAARTLIDFGASLTIKDTLNGWTVIDELTASEHLQVKKNEEMKRLFETHPKVRAIKQRLIE